MTVKRCLAVSVLLASLFALAPRAGATTTVKQANFYGDSLMQSLTTSLTQADAAQPAWIFDDRAIPHTAPCDMLPRLRADMASSSRPDVVVIEDIGNGSTACMLPYPVGSAAYFAKYRSDFAAMFAAAHPARLFYVQSPPMYKPGTDAMVARVNAIGIDEATKAGAQIITAPRNHLSINGAFTWTINGVTVRQPDGVHFTAAGAAIFAQPLVTRIETAKYGWSAPRR